MERYFIVVPCYNEQEVLPETFRRLGECLTELTEAGFARFSPRATSKRRTL